MALNTLSEVTILIWPVLILIAVLSAVFLPDRLAGSIQRQAAGWMSIIFAVAFFWFIPIYLVLSIPYTGDIEKVEFWASVWHVLKDAAAHLTAPWALAIVSAYVVAGIVWAVVYFWLYARRLGQQYVQERDSWMRDNDLKSLEGLTPAKRKEFSKVLNKVKEGMLYEGDFPLRPLQQKRFFAANLMLWPATLLCYLIGDMALDVARHIWFALRNWIRRYWEKGMAEYLADDALCRARLAEMQPATKP
ncbi:hypothetical protein [Burkholderia ubonensis]|uniref:hypothetical protein n=1 Tax=Burkholderia ubonensis TaxID=101571 RepID=UPI0007574B49|nr:hypothetical protein [Burkholderia ubonensis]KVP39676.1 hypothetical protein WJ87_05695 [Burkholderia ubonensis]